MEMFLMILLTIVCISCCFYCNGLKRHIEELEDAIIWEELTE